MGVRVPRAPELHDLPDLRQSIWQVRELAAGNVPALGNRRLIIALAVVLAVSGVAMMLLALCVALIPESPVSQLVLRLFVSGGE